ncbi:MAG TPA: hypothetical protein VNL77_17475 [Roseiflexaceae bacterium]|nr:hypothetical protein [Roseiflexaceae bacterium]
MSPIYKMYLGRYTPLWYALSAEERYALEAAAQAAFTAAGGQSLADCSADAASDGWQWFGLEQFPDRAAVEQYHAALADLGWHRYVAELAVLGIERARGPSTAVRERG